VYAEIRTIHDQALTLQTVDGEQLQLSLTPHARVTTSPRDPGDATDLQVGQWVRAQVLKDDTGQLVTGNVHMVRQNPPAGQGIPNRLHDKRASLESRKGEQLSFSGLSAPLRCGTSGGESPTGDWPMLGYDPAHGFYNQAEQQLAPPLLLDWVRPGQWTTSSPAVVGNIIYAGGYDAFYALDITTHDVLWTQTISGDNELSSPVVANGTVYFGTWTGDLYALQAETGDKEWRTNLWPADDFPVIYSPIVTNGVVYVTLDVFSGDYKSIAYAVNQDNGLVNWMRIITSSPEPNTVSDPVVMGDVMYAATMHQGVFALDTRDGHELWHFVPPDDPILGPPVSSNVNFSGYLIVQSGKVLVPVTYGPYGGRVDKLFALNSTTGAVEWVYAPSPSGPQEFSSTLLAHNHLIYVMMVESADPSTYTHLVAIRAADGFQQAVVTATHTIDDGGWWWLSAANGIIYRTSASLYVRGFDMASGEEVFAYQTLSSIETPATPGGGRLVVADEEDRISGERHLYVFGNMPSQGGLCGTVYEDKSVNCVYDLGDVGVSGVTVTLTGVDYQGNPVTAVTVTNVNGDYFFTDLVTGTYTVVEIDLPGWLSVSATVGSTGGVMQDPNTIADIPLASQSSTGNNFGDVRPVTITGVIFDDVALDATYSGSETGIAGITVDLLRNGAPYRSIGSNADGRYTFDTLLPGTYTVVETDQSGYFSTTPNSVVVAATTPDQTYNAHFGDAQYVTVTAFVYNDTDLNGLPDGNPGIGAVRITLDGQDYLGTPVHLVDYTAGDGTYVLVGRLPGTYTVSQTNGDGFFSTTPDLVNVSALTPGQTYPVQFGDARYAQLSGAVYFDRDQDGSWDTGEPPLPGPSINLTGNDYTGAPVTRDVVAGTGGAFAFGSLKPGNYTLAETDLPIFLSVAANPGSAGGVVANANTIASIQLDPGTDALDYRFGDVTPPPQVAVSKQLITPAGGQAAPGSEVVFRIAVTNTGQTTLTQVPLRDQYEVGRLSYLSASLTPDDGTDDGELVWSDLTTLLGRDLRPGERAEVEIHFQARSGAMASALSGKPDPGAVAGIGPQCVFNISLHPTCEGWSVRFDNQTSRSYSWRVKVDGTVITEGTTRGNETVSGTWPAWVDLTTSHTFRAEVNENGQWYGKSASTPVCAISVRTRNLAVVSGATDEWGLVAPDASGEAWVNIGQSGTTRTPTPTLTPSTPTATPTPAATCTSVVIQRGTYGQVSDAYIWSTSPDYTGNSDSLYTGMVSGGRKRSLLRFESSDPVPSGAVVDWATFKIYLKGNSGGSTVNLHRITVPWAESSVTWNQFNNGFATAVLGAFNPAGNGWYSVDVTALAQAWVGGTYPNYGVLLDQPAALGYEVYYASEYGTVSKRPKLGVCFHVADSQTPTPMPTAPTATQTPTPTPTPSISCSPGLIGAYYKPGGTVNNYPNWSALAPNYTLTDNQVNFASTTGAFNGLSDFVDDFGVRWTGKINVTDPGRYTFFTKSDDGSRLYIDGRFIVNNDGQHSMQERSGTITLRNGLHDVDLWFFERGGNAGVILSWDPPSSSKTVVPASALCH
jgi:uncharacterized repeat protein (TIGR01451 family)